MKKLYFLLITFLFIQFVKADCNDPSNIRIINDFYYEYQLLIQWDANGESLWDIEYGISGFSPTGIPTFNDTSYSQYYLDNIETHDYIDFYVRADCGGNTSNWIGPLTFYNYCFEWVYYGDLEENFENTFSPECWAQANEGNPNVGISNINNSAWEQADFVNNNSNSKAAKVTITGTNTNEWFVLPPMKGIMGLKNRDGNKLTLEINLGLTESGTTDAATLGSDDKVELIISPDLGVTWYHIKTWDHNSTISNTGEYIYLEYLNNTDGFDMYQKVFLLAFWASSGSIDNGTSLDFFIDSLNAVPPFTGAVGDLKSKGFVLYPNPAKDYIDFSARETIEDISLYNQLGQEIKYQKINSLQSQINLMSIPKGIYYMRINIGTTSGIVPIFKN